MMEFCRIKLDGEMTKLTRKAKEIWKRIRWEIVSVVCGLAAFWTLVVVGFLDTF